MTGGRSRHRCVTCHTSPQRPPSFTVPYLTQVARRVALRALFLDSASFLKSPFCPSACTLGSLAPRMPPLSTPLLMQGYQTNLLVWAHVRQGSHQRVPLGCIPKSVLQCVRRSFVSIHPSFHGSMAMDLWNRLGSVRCEIPNLSCVRIRGHESLDQGNPPSIMIPIRECSERKRST